jgi:hypothetical protein
MLENSLKALFIKALYFYISRKNQPIIIKNLIQKKIYFKIIYIFISF